MHDEILDVVHGFLMLSVKNERDVLSGEFDEWPGVLREVPDKYPNEAAGTEKAADAREAVGNGPVADFLCLGFMRDATVVIAALTEEEDGGDADLDFLAGKRTANVFDSLDDPVDVVEVLPDKLSDAGIFRDCFVGTIGEFVSAGQSFDRDVVNERDGEGRDLILKCEVNVALHYLHRVGVSHH